MNGDVVNFAPFTKSTGASVDLPHGSVEWQVYGHMNGQMQQC